MILHDRMKISCENWHLFVCVPENHAWVKENNPTWFQGFSNHFSFFHQKHFIGIEISELFHLQIFHDDENTVGANASTNRLTTDTRTLRDWLSRNPRRRNISTLLRLLLQPTWKHFNVFVQKWFQFSLISSFGIIVRRKFSGSARFTRLLARVSLCSTPLVTWYKSRRTSSNN